MTADGESEGQSPDPGRWLEGEVERRHPEVSETHAEYGGLLLRLYETGFGDRRALSFVNLYAYGGGFDMLAALAAKVLPFDLFETRRLCGAAVGLIGLFVGRNAPSVVTRNSRAPARRLSDVSSLRRVSVRRRLPRIRSRFSSPR